ncbi:vacuolar protein-sorting-associated protein 36-like isoform X1 [Dreissena polymorpha]|uniref:vacuolar protein-sorting-associated protein 36-like isoform X1 n=1 Tax=Dreissena polymorpha TaxID=45954 RepID=UPI0022650E14|nr:vacuolar protein-sorting-associated protein 36-like isoform X1 [Dreissena polymorpha]
MNRFQWGDTNLSLGEDSLTNQTGIALYDGESKTNFEGGVANITSHRLVWKEQYGRTTCLSLPLSLVQRLEEQASGFAKSAKIVVHLSSPVSGQQAGPASSSKYDYIRLSFRDGGQQEFLRYLVQALREKKWEKKYVPPAPPGAPPGAVAGRHRPGIVGIERSIQQKQQQTDTSIDQSFQDLKKLMEKAQEMVSLSKSIVTKIRDKQGEITEDEVRDKQGEITEDEVRDKQGEITEDEVRDKQGEITEDEVRDKQGEITEDETIKFKSYLLSMGIPNPVTKETHGTGDKYYRELAKELASVLEKPIKDCGGMMTMTDVYCRVNRARGMELISPEDLLNACETFEELRLPIKLRRFESGVMVLQSSTHSEEEVIKKTTEVVESKGSLTAEELAQNIGLSVILAKERLLLTERVGGVCRDDSEEGLRFYPNLLLTKT